MKKIYSLAIAMVMAMLTPGLNTLGAATYYWVGGTGTWSDYSNHWATSSGGSVFHTQMPGAADDVVFDANSFGQAGDTVYLDVSDLYLSGFSSSGITDTLRFLSVSPTVAIECNGAFVNNSFVDWQIGQTTLSLTSPLQGTALKLGGINIDLLTFNGSGQIIWQEDFASLGQILVFQGDIIIDVDSISLSGNFQTIGGLSGSISLLQSNMIINTFELTNPSIILDAETARIGVKFNTFVGEDFGTVFGEIYTEKSNDIFQVSTSLVFFNCTITKLTVNYPTIIGLGSSNFGQIVVNEALQIRNQPVDNFTRSIQINSNLFIYDNYRIDTISFGNLGGALMIQNDVYLFTNYITPNQTCTGRVSIESIDDILTPVNYNLDIAYISSNSSSIDIINANITGIVTSGSAQFNATVTSPNLGQVIKVKNKK
jgi:hypothetical protein